jgi:hypothetical protein
MMGADVKVVCLQGRLPSEPTVGGQWVVINLMAQGWRPGSSLRLLIHGFLQPVSLAVRAASGALTVPENL